MLCYANPPVILSALPSTVSPRVDNDSPNDYTSCKHDYRAFYVYMYPFHFH